MSRCRGVPKIEALNADGLALKAHAPFTDQFADDCNRLAGAGQRLAVHHPMLDLRLVTGPEAQNEATAGQGGNGGGGHRDRRCGADEHAADAGAEPYARGPHRAGRQDSELIAAMTFRDPGGLIAEALGEDDKVDDLGRVGAARNGDADPAHALLSGLSDQGSTLRRWMPVRAIGRPRASGFPVAGRFQARRRHGRTARRSALRSAIAGARSRAPMRWSQCRMPSTM
jgi:hypothetical protein